MQNTSNFEYKTNSPLDLLKTNPKTTAIIVGLIALVFAFFIIIGNLSNKTNPQGAVISSSFDFIPKDVKLTYGNPNSKIKVVIVEDIQCPGCQSLTKGEGGLATLKEEIKDIAEINYKLVQITPGHTFTPEATKIILASELVNKKGVELQDWIYNNVTNVSTLSSNDLKKGMDELSIDSQKVYQEAKSELVVKQYNQNNKDMQFAFEKIEGYSNKEFRVSGTPSVIVYKDGKPVRFSSNDSTVFAQGVKPLSANTKDIIDYIKELSAQN
jgi:protein-disulfide isomerase